MTRKALIHCAWCGLDLPPTKKDRPIQHKAGKKTCVGSGQVRATHEMLNKAKSENSK